MAACVPVRVTFAVPLPTTPAPPAAVTASVPLSTDRTTWLTLFWVSATEIVLPPVNANATSSLAVTVAGAVLTGGVFVGAITWATENSEVLP